MYKIPTYQKTSLRSPERSEGEMIETKVERIMTNKEAIKDGAPIIYTEKSEGIQAAYNIRTDRWEIAVEAMDKVHKIKAATPINNGKTGDDNTKKSEGGKDDNSATQAESTVGK